MIYAALAPGSVLDIGCGSGRLLRTFSRRPHSGFDVSKKAIRMLKSHSAHPENFWVDDLTTTTHDHLYNNVVSMVTLQHIPNDKIAMVADKLKSWGKNIVLIESLDDGKQWADHCFKHDYEQLFTIHNKAHLYDSVWIMQAIGGL